ncbi:ABC transporter permease [Bailinhaonella thermotolerans]|uniref:ABC transporter permease n=1 Tax=Bailinhaonella thermotolerans TaxID=1070861 RepID=A0A3A4AN38_9ACTN|nr:ABC transporter permease [Bailinhaonella thermotolerans]RJL30411.1 ABC transporter permease [Bailinhaonella thermotolerans]
MRALAIAGLGLRRLFRERINIFFVIILPIAMILIFGVSFGGFEPKLGLTGGQDGPLARRLAAETLRTQGVVIERAAGERALREAVERGEITAGLVIPAGYDAAVREGREVVVRYISRDDPAARQIGAAVRAAITQETYVLRAARFAVSRGGGDFDRGLAAARNAARALPGIRIESATAGTRLFPETVTSFNVAAGSQLLLFMFLTSLTGAAALIETRRLGLSRRMYATPASASAILLGEGLGRVGVALAQGLVIMLGSALLFGVGWGDPLGAAALLVCFSLVGGGAAMLMGAVFRTEQQAVSLGLLLGLGLAALGGSMLPLELFPEGLRVVARLTPHGWANEGFAALTRHGADIAGIVPQLGALTAFAVVLFAVGAWRLRVALTRG